MAEQQSGSKQNAQSASQGGSGSQQITRSPSSGGMLRPGFDPFLFSPREFFSANPFSLLRRMSEEMDRVFGEFGLERGRGGTGTWSPAVEVAEREGNYVVHAELPGLKPEDVKVEVGDQGLVIQGERKFEQEQNQGGVHRTERQYGQFYRNIPLPEGVNPEQVRANFQNGVLEVTVPIPQAQSNRREIPIETAAAASTIESAKAAKG
jgi:HSP20 family protein